MARSGHHFAKTHAQAHATRRAFVAWLAVFALFAQVLAPLSSALAFEAGAGDEFQVICTANGVKTITINQDGEPPHPAAARSCPFCITHTAPGIFTPEAITVTATVTPFAQNFAQPIAYVQSSIWRGSPQPARAPPLSI